MPRSRSRSVAGGWPALAAQALLLGLVMLAVLWLTRNAATNLQARGIPMGFGFLGLPAGFDIPQRLVPYQPSDTHFRVFLVGAANTLLVAGLGIVFATIVGLVAGVLRLSRNFLGRALATVYVEGARNTPLPVQLLLWYSLMLAAPPPRDAIQLLPGFFLTNRGLYFPTDTIPRLEGFGFTGGASLSLPLAALLLGLIVYTGGFIAEVVRGGLQAVPKGQTEAARALGLKEGHVLRHVVLPQALRVMVPPLASQYLNLTKNSSLAVLIGYPDLVAVFGGTSLNQTGQAIEIIAMLMAFYLAVSLSISAFMNWWNSRTAVWERRT
ncbi:MAG TPA: ABC transporter permease subunit [Caulobacteraceae bacterium]|jgi:general L-amino acid transport system permease protein